MLTRYFTAIGLMFPAVLIVLRLFGRRQQKALHELVVLAAKVIAAVMVLALLRCFLIQD